MGGWCLWFIEFRKSSWTPPPLPPSLVNPVRRIVRVRMYADYDPVLIPTYPNYGTRDKGYKIIIIISSVSGYSRNIVDETTKRVSKFILGQLKVRNVHGVPTLFGQQHVLHLIAEHRKAQHWYAVIRGFDRAVYSAVGDEQLAFRVTCAIIVPIRSSYSYASPSRLTARHATYGSPNMSFCGNHFRTMTFRGKSGKRSFSHFHNTVCSIVESSANSSDTVSRGIFDDWTTDPKLKYTTPRTDDSTIAFRSCENAYSDDVARNVRIFRYYGTTHDLYLRQS